MYVRDKNEMSVFMWSITMPYSSEAQTPNFNHSFNHLVEIYLLQECGIEGPPFLCKSDRHFDDTSGRKVALLGHFF